MNTKIKNIFSGEILPWYKKHGRKLPWRKPRISAYEVWVSEIMLQQTQVLRVTLYYERFLKKFPTVRQLARASWKEFLPYWDGLGYYNRGRNMLKAAKIITAIYRGKFPSEKKLLVQLPGIGEYTACAILSFAYGKPEVAFDTNFRKIFGTREKAEQAFRESGVSSKLFNSAVMDWGSMIVTKRISRKRASSRKHYSLTKTHVILHENHKKYYSLDKRRYKPFVMPENVASRQEIKKYFLETYGLKVSVRPPQKREDAEGRATIVVNAQVLLGKPGFSVYNKAQIT